MAALRNNRSVRLPALALASVALVLAVAACSSDAGRAEPSDVSGVAQELAPKVPEVETLVDVRIDFAMKPPSSGEPAILLIGLEDAEFDVTSSAIEYPGLGIVTGNGAADCPAAQCIASPKGLAIIGQPDYRGKIQQGYVGPSGVRFDEAASGSVAGVVKITGLNPVFEPLVVQGFDTTSATGTIFIDDVPHPFVVDFDTPPTSISFRRLLVDDLSGTFEHRASGDASSEPFSVGLIDAKASLVDVVDFGGVATGSIQVMAVTKAAAPLSIELPAVDMGTATAQNPYDGQPLVLTGPGVATIGGDLSVELTGGQVQMASSQQFEGTFSTASASGVGTLTIQLSN